MPRATIQGIDLHYLVHGLAEGESVVLINGFTAPLEMWAPTVPALVADYRVVTYDLRGHGRSDLPFGGYDLTTQSDDLRGLLDHLRIERAHLVGDAAGGGIAVELALRHPERVQSLTLIGTRIHGWKEPAGAVPPATEDEEAYNQEFQRRFKEDSLPEILEWWWRGEWSRPMREDAIRRRALRFRDLILSHPGGAWQASLPTRPVPPHHPRLSEIQAPTLIIIGGADMPVIKAHAMEWRRGIRHAVFAEILDAGHVPSWEFPAQFNQGLTNFLGTLAR